VGNLAGHDAMLDVAVGKGGKFSFESWPTLSQTSSSTRLARAGSVSFSKPTATSFFDAQGARLFGKEKWKRAIAGNNAQRIQGRRHINTMTGTVLLDSHICSSSRAISNRLESA